MELFPTKDQAFWEEVWVAAIEKAPAKYNGNANVKRWDRMAPNFAKKVSGEEAARRKEKIFSMLTAAGALKSGTTVLDIGAGPGNWAIPMAESGAIVTALEPSGGMINELEKRMAEKGVDNIRVIQDTWQDIHLDGEGLGDGFDLVFASMSPGVRDPETLQKMMTASNGFCYLSTFSGGGWRNSYNAMWKTLFGKELKENSWDFIYPFNYVYSLGYRPAIQFNTWEYEREETVEDAAENILLFLEGQEEITPEVREKVGGYIEERSENGMYIQKRKVCQGAMVWQVKDL